MRLRSFINGGFPGGWFCIGLRSQDFVLDVAKNGSGNVIGWPRHGGANQQWRYNRKGCLR